MGAATFPIRVLLSTTALVASLLVLTLGAELLVRGSVVVARRLRVSSFFIGLTIVGFGTSTPELFTTLIATAKGRVDLAVGNVVGSNIFNIAFILGSTALVTPILVRLDVVRGQAWLVVAISLAPFLALAADRHLTRPMGAFLLATLAAYLWRGYRQGRRDGEAELRAEAKLEEEMAGAFRGRWSGPRGGAAFVALGLLLLVGGSRLLVDSATTLAVAFGVSELAIGLTVVACGTSAPELFTSLVAAVRRQPDLAVGNVLGSNVFNLAGILGLSAVLRPQALHPQVLLLDAPVMLALSVALIPILATGSRISRGEGAFFLGSYAAYLWLLLAWAHDPARSWLQG